MRRPSGVPIAVRHPTQTFVVLALLFTWSISIPLALSDRGVLPLDLPLALHYLTPFGPLAASLLRDTNVPVASVAQDVGYDSEESFARAFKRLVGSPPAAWRTQAGNR